MRKNTIIMLGLALVSGALAIIGADSWLAGRADAQRQAMAATAPVVETRTLVVAKAPLRFGNEVSAHVLKEIPWPTSAVPAGSFATIRELLGEGKRVVLAPIEPDEPILSQKITGSGEKATLAALINQRKRAITIRVNDVVGVAGFVTPGDRVDVLLTRKERSDNDKGSDAVADVILQGKRVLAVDQSADERSTGPSVVKAVTLEVDPFEAQKTALAASIGTLSLMLRPEGEGQRTDPRTVTLADLTNPTEAPAGTAEKPAEKAKAGPALATVFVTGAEGRKAYQVPVE